jgi:hypothetical protein
MFISKDGSLDSRPDRPLAQGDVFEAVTLAAATITKRGEPHFRAKPGQVMLVAPSCAIRKGGTDDLADLIHMAPLKAISKLADPTKDTPLHVLSLPELTIDGEPAGADLGRIGMANSMMLSKDDRLACVTLSGVRAVKARLIEYFARYGSMGQFLGPAAHEEWHEVDLWEKWTARNGSESGFQAWLDEVHPPLPSLTRREAIVADLPGVKAALEAAGG